MGPGEDRIVIELGVARQADAAPMLDERLDDPGCCDRPLVRPRADQAAMQRDGVEDLQIRAVLDGQALDDVEAVQLGLPCGHGGEIPARRWRRAAHPSLAVQGPASPEDAADGADRGQRGRAPFQEGREDRLGAAVAQVAVLGQLPPQVQDQVLDAGWCASRRAGDGRSVLPIHPVQSRTACPLDPVVYRRLADTELTSDFVLGQAAPDGLDDLTTAWNRQALLLMATSRRSEVSVKATPWRATGRSFEARRRTDVNDRQVVAAT